MAPTVFSFPSYPIFVIMTTSIAALALARQQLRLAPRRAGLSSRSYASISDPSHSEILNASSAASSSSPVEARRQQAASPQERRTATQLEQERKFRQYEKVLKAKAAE